MSGELSISAELSMSGETGSDSLIWSFIFKINSAGMKWRHRVLKVCDADTHNDVNWQWLADKVKSALLNKTSVDVDSKNKNKNDCKKSSQNLIQAFW